jgi:hypothetical protein
LIKKSDKFGFNLTKKAIFTLQALGFLDTLKQSTGKNTSKFVSEAIIGYTQIFYPSSDRVSNENMLKFQLRELQKERDSLEDKIQEIAYKLSKIRESNNKGEMNV